MVCAIQHDQLLPCDWTMQEQDQPAILQRPWLPPRQQVAQRVRSSAIPDDHWGWCCEIPLWRPDHCRSLVLLGRSSVAGAEWASQACRGT